MGLKRADYSYRHPSKPPNQAETAVQLDPERKTLEPVPLPVAHSSDRAVVGSRPLAAAETSGRQRLAFDITFAVPTHGRLELYEEMIASGISSKTAILAIGKRALQSYERSADHLDHASLLAGFGTVKFEHATRRVMDAEAHDRAKAALDPYGVRSGKEIGRLLGRIVIQHWIESGSNLVS